MYSYEKKTAGENLCAYLYDYSIDSMIWDRLEQKHLLVTGYPEEFHVFFREAIAVNLTRRLILAGESVKKHILPSEAGFPEAISKVISRWNLGHLNRDGALARLVRDSLIASNHGISLTLRRRTLKTAERTSQKCYMCGVSFNFSLDPSRALHNDITIDHIWPQAYGGESIPENLLPACRSCNAEKKQDYPSWSGCDIQSVAFGIGASEGSLESLNGRFRFALHNRFIRQLANKTNISLQEAYLKVGAWTSAPWLIDESEVGDFFNLANYNEDRIPYGRSLI